jgi:hypothetical protein
MENNQDSYIKCSVSQEPIQKTCIKCEVLKDITCFYKHKMMSDGHLGKCKECCKKDQLATRNANLEYYREYDRRRSLEHDRKEQYLNKTRRMRDDHQGMQKAHNAVARALAKGSLIRPDKCSRCEAVEYIQGHHDDYSKPMEIMWLCPLCHANRHKELGRLGDLDI